MGETVGSSIGTRHRIENFFWFIENKGCSYKYIVDGHPNDWRKQKTEHIWKKCMSNIDLDEPTSFFDNEYMGCAERESKPNEIIIEQRQEMFESRISVEAIEKLPWEKIRQRQLRGLTTSKNMHRNALGDIATWHGRQEDRTMVQSVQSLLG